MRSRESTRGFSLIEALVALVVMGFGMLGVLGIQSALRQYSDLSKQRSEAVRLAQEGTERWRAFAKLDPDGGVVDYADIATHAAVAVTGPLATPGSTNTTYTIERIVDRLDGALDLPESGRWLQTTLRWDDRTGTQQRVDFFTHISGVSPELAGTLLVPPGGAVRPVQGRHPAIPRTAIDVGGGKSEFVAPGLPSTTWTFDNLTGEITKICNPVCTTDPTETYYLLSGYVRFADPDPPPGTFRQPTPAEAELPTSSSASFGTVEVRVDQTAPVGGTVLCAAQPFPTYVAYYCAMRNLPPSAPTGTLKLWSGRSYVYGPVFATDAADFTSSKARNCRYTPLDTDAAANADHPLDYGSVKGPLVNQNFLMIRAGDGTTAFTCPDDDTSTPYVNGNTFRHQPAS